MNTFVMLTRLDRGTSSPAEVDTLEREIMARVRAECAGVEWRSSLALLGPADYLDIFDAPDIDTAMKVATIVRTFGHASTEVWSALEWKHFKALVATIPLIEPSAVGRP